MENISTSAELKFAIEQLKIEQAEKGRLLKEQCYITYEAFKPIGLLKSVIKDIVSPSNLVDNLVGTAISIGSGYLSNKIVVGGSHNLFRKLLGTITQLGVTNVVAKNSNSIETFGKYLLHQLIHKKK